MKSRSLLLFIPAALLCVLASVYFIRYLVKPQIGLVVNFPEVVLRDGWVVFSPKTPFSSRRRRLAPGA